MTAIRSAGDAVLVDLVALSSPYTVEAIGDAVDMQTALARASAGQHLATLRATYGIGVAAVVAEPARAAGHRPGHAARGRACPRRRRTEPASPPGRVRRTRPVWQGRQVDGEGWHVIAVIGLVIGVVGGLLLQPTVPLELQPYLPIAVVAALDALFGGLRAMLDGIFDDRVFLISFLSNVVVAALIVFLGDQLGVGTQLSTAVVVVLGIRIFSNAASIRRHLFKA